MTHLSVSQIFLVFAYEPAVSLQPTFTLSSLLSPAPQHLAGLPPAITWSKEENESPHGVNINIFPGVLYLKVKSLENEICT